MTMEDTVRHVAARLDLPQQQVKSVLLAAAAYAGEILSRGEKVTLPGIGTLEGRWRSPRVVRSIADARKTLVGGRYVVRYQPNSAIKRVLEARSPQAWRSPQHQTAWRLAETLISDLALYHAAKAPSDLDAATPPKEVHTVCLEAFGDLWARVEAEWAARVPEAVRTDHDYLAHSALARWAVRP